MEYSSLVGFNKEFVDYLILFAYIIFGVTTILAVVFALLPLFQNLKKALTTLAGIGGLVLFYLLCYMLTSGDPFTITTGTGDETTSGAVMKLVEANMFMTYITLVIALLAILYSSIASYFK